MEIVFTTSNGIFARLIKWFTRSSVSHVLLHVYDYFVFEAGGTKVKLRPWSSVTGIVAKFRIKESAVSSVIIDRCVQEAMLEHGKGYDWFGIVGFAYCILVERLFKKDVKNPFARQSSYWCSELIAFFLNKVNAYKNIGLSLKADDFSPEDLLKLLRSRPDVFEEIK